MAKDSIKIKVVPVVDPADVDKIKLDVEKGVKDAKISVDATATVDLDNTSAEQKITELQEKISNLESKIKVEADASQADASIVSLERSLNNIGERARSIQSIRDQFKSLEGQALTFNDVLAATSASFNVLGKTNLGQLASSIKTIGSQVKNATKEVKSFGTSVKQAFSKQGISGFTSGLKQVPSLMKQAASGAKAFGAALKSALGVVQLIISSIQAVVQLAMLMPGVGDGIKALLEKLPGPLKQIVGNLLGVELSEAVAKLSAETVKVQKELENLIKSGGTLSKERMLQITNEKQLLEDKLQLLELEESRGKKLTEQDNIRKNDMAVRLQAYESLLDRYKEEEKQVEKIQKQYHDFDAELKKLQQTEDQLNKTSISLEFDDSIKGQIDEVNKAHLHSLQLLEKNNAESIKNIDKLVLKDNAKKKKTQELLAQQQKNYNLERENLEKQHQLNLSKITADITDPDIFRKNNAEVLKDLNKYYNSRIQLVSGNLKEEARLLAEYNSRVADITTKQQKQVINDLEKSFDSISEKASQYKSKAPSSLFVNTANDFARALGIMKDAIRGEDFNSIVDKHLNIQKMQATLEEMYSEINNFGVKYKEVITSLVETQFTGLNISPDAKQKTEERISNVFSNIDNLIKTKFEVDIGELIEIHGEDKASKMIEDAITESTKNIEDELKLENIDVDISSVTPAMIKGLSNVFKSTKALRTEINGAKESFNSFVKNVNQGGQFAGYANQLTQLLIQTKGVFSPELEDSAAAERDYNAKRTEIRKRLLAGLIETEDEYYVELTELEIEHQENMNRIAEENRKAKAEYYATSLSSVTNIFNADITRMMDEANGSMESLAGNSQLTAAVIGSGLTASISGLVSGMAQGEMTVGSFFKSILQGALQALPGLAALIGLTNPWALLGIGAGIIGLIALIDTLTAEQSNKYFEGGLVQGASGKDNVSAKLTRNEYVVPADITMQHLPRLQRLRYTGQWNQPGLYSTAAIENKLDSINNTLKQQSAGFDVRGHIKVDSAFFSNVNALTMLRKHNLIPIF
jgi:hypothetical protein